MMSNGYFAHIHRHPAAWTKEEEWYVDLEGDVWYLDIIILYNSKIYINYWWLSIVCSNTTIMSFIEHWTFQIALNIDKKELTGVKHNPCQYL